MIGIGVGLSTVNAVAGGSSSASLMSMGAGLCWVIAEIAAASVGGYLAGRLSGKPSHSTTAYHGLIAWAVSALIIIYLRQPLVCSSVQGAVQTATPSFNSVSDPM